MDEITFKRLLAHKMTLRRSSTVLRAYQSNENPSAPLKVMGKFEAIVESNTRIAPAKFHVIKGHTNNEPLIGFQTAEDLGLVKVANTVQSEETITSNLLKEYADLFRGIGKMKGVKVDLHVDPAITPVAQAHRRIPFSVRPKLEAELEKLEADDIIERVEKPTSWVSPVVITPKRSSNEIRLNVDMREANKAIPRTHTAMPTLDDIINELNRATVFSHLIIFLVPAEDKDIVTDVDASNHVLSGFFADGFLEYLPIGSPVPVETYMCRKSGDVAAILLQFQLVVPMVHIKTQT